MSAAEAAVAALPADAAPVEIVGDTELARALHVLLGPRADVGGRNPAAVLETTGEPRLIEGALQRVDDLGTVVLAGPPPAEPMSLDLYADLHLRGLTVIGLPGPGAAAT